MTPPDLIFLDVRLPGRSGLKLLETWKKQYSNLPIIMMSGDSAVTEAVEAVKNGAYDFIEKRVLTQRLLNVTRTAIKVSRLEEISTSSQSDTEIKGSSSALQKNLNDIQKLAPTKARVLITGESGTGKSLLAHAIHMSSARNNNGFFKVNCAAIPESLMESELFGHVKGAFTGASKARRGLFEQANGGTLFLDEIGEMSMSAQAKILLVLQNNEITPVGSSITIPVDVRIICATNCDLRERVSEGKFREDLFYRLDVTSIHCPSLRERKDDIPLLTQSFAEEICKEYAIPEKKVSSEVMNLFQVYNWPGNVRELRNVVERMMIMGGNEISIEDLRSNISKTTSESSHQGNQFSSSQEFIPMSWEEFRSYSDREYLQKMLDHCEWNVSKAARILKVDRSTVHKWLNQNNIKKPA